MGSRGREPQWEGGPSLLVPGCAALNAATVTSSWTCSSSFMPASSANSRGAPRSWAPTVTGCGVGTSSTMRRGCRWGAWCWSAGGCCPGLPSCRPGGSPGVVYWSGAAVPERRRPVQQGSGAGPCLWAAPHHWATATPLQGLASSALSVS